MSSDFSPMPVKLTRNSQFRSIAWTSCYHANFGDLERHDSLKNRVELALI